MTAVWRVEQGARRGGGPGAHLLVSAAAMACAIVVAPGPTAAASTSAVADVAGASTSAAADVAGVSTPVRLTATIDDTPAADATEQHPVALDPDSPLQLVVSISNEGDDEVSIRSLRFEGVVMGLTFFSYDTRVGLDVPAHGTATRRYPLDLVGLRGQATGLIPARVVALDADRHAVASQGLVVDVRGSARSVYGAFGLAVAAFTGLSLAGALLGLARHQLSANRWRRGVRFCWPGIGVGLLLVFTLSAFRVFVPQPHRWVPIVAVSAVALFVVGYLTPTPDEPDEPGEPDAHDEPDVRDAPEGPEAQETASATGVAP